MSNITPSQADTVLEVNRANAIKQAISKVKSKKTFTKAEVDLLQSIAYSPGQKGDLTITEAKTVVDLAAALGVYCRHCGHFEYTDLGLKSNIFIKAIPVRMKPGTTGNEQ